ncbi:DoxX family protein [Tunturiibacter lichenicola]|uniref:DoxX family protein n=1 Tax=Tunturiibacter lichenicola TaxID=2051959 RepID=UPI0021B21510|nr:DoxX family protein [Edaphobacter lichenicola]
MLVKAYYLLFGLFASSWVFCLIIEGAKLTATLQTREFFAALGWGQWFRYFTGFLDVTGSVLLFVPRQTAWGALMLTCSVGAASLVCLFILRQYGAAAPLLFTALALTLAWLTRPRPKAKVEGLAA